MIKSTGNKWQLMMILSTFLVLLLFTIACAAEKNQTVSSFPYKAAQKFINQENGGECTFFGYHETAPGQVSVFYKGPQGNIRDPKPFILLMSEKGSRWFYFSVGDRQSVAIE